VITKLGAGGQVSFFNAVGSTDLTADVLGYFDPTQGSRFHALPGPMRILDDRVGIGLTGPWGPDTSRSLALTAGTSIPTAATGVIMNTTVTGASSGSLVTVYPSGSPRPGTSNLNFGPGQTIANLVISPIPAAGSVEFYNLLGSVDIIGDATGYFSAT